jgi:alpha-tubulin suppressor-like RCC1 family protein
MFMARWVTARTRSNVPVQVERNRLERIAAGGEFSIAPNQNGTIWDGGTTLKPETVSRKRIFCSVDRK